MTLCGWRGYKPSINKHCDGDDDDDENGAMMMMMMMMMEEVVVIIVVVGHTDSQPAQHF